MIRELKIVLGISAALAIIFVGGEVYKNYVPKQEVKSDNLGDGVGIGTLPVFNVVNNAILPRTSTWDFCIGSNTASASANDFCVDAGNNTIELNSVVYTFPSADGSSGQVLHTNGSGTLSWNTDDSGGGGGAASIEVRDFPNNATSISPVASITFHSEHFEVTASGSSDALIKLDWGTDGPASLSQAETILGNWVNTASPWADNEVADGLTINGGTIGNNTLSSGATFTGSASISANFEILGYASASFFQGTAFGGIDCNDAADQLLWSGGVFTCESLGDDDIPNNITIDLATSASDLTCTDCINATEIEDIYLLNSGDTSTGLQIFSAGASVTTNFEVSGTASVSALKVGGNSISGTNTGDVTLAGTPDYITISGQVITRAKLDISDDTNATGGTGITISANDFSFNSTEIEATTWGAGGNSSNLWTFNLTAGDPTLRWTTSGASFSLNWENIGYVSASFFKGSAFPSSNCTTAGQALQWATTGLITCATGYYISGGTDVSLADGGTGASLADPNDDRVMLWDDSAGAIVFADFSSGNKITTTATPYLTIGSNSLGFGEWLASASLDTHTETVAGAFDYIINLSSTGDFRIEDNGTTYCNFSDTGVIDCGAATAFELPNGTGPTFSALGQFYYDSSLEFVKVATQSAGPGAVIPVKPVLWSATIASTSIEFVSGGRLPLPPKPSGVKYIIVGIACSVDSGTSVVINASNMTGTFDSETVTCDLDGQEDTTIDTNANYTTFTKASSSLEFGTVTGSPDYLTFTIYGYLSE